MPLNIKKKKGSTFDGTAQVWGGQRCRQPLEILKSLDFSVFVLVEPCTNTLATAHSECAEGVQL